MRRKELARTVEEVAVDRCGLMSEMDFCPFEKEGEEIVTFKIPSKYWDTIFAVLSADAESSYFEQPLREDIKAALDSIEIVEDGDEKQEGF